MEHFLYYDAVDYEVDDEPQHDQVFQRRFHAEERVGDLHDHGSTSNFGNVGTDGEVNVDGYEDEDLLEALLQEMDDDEGDEDRNEMEFDFQCLGQDRDDIVEDLLGDMFGLDIGATDHIYDQHAETKPTSKFVAGAMITLPPGCRHTDKTVYEEVIVPANDHAPVGVGDELVKISSLDPTGQLAFRGVKTLNRIQSVVFQTAYNTSENLLICAPTGAGKTNIAMLTILQEVRKHLNPLGAVKHNEFKVIYVAPMKALAAEMVRTFGTRLQPLGLTVRELTGDMQLTKKEMMDTHMIVTTPEKWDVVTRKSVGDAALTQLVKLLIIDEVHLLHEDRGAVIESLVARTLRQVESYQNHIRIVGLSATLPNYKDVARFLHVNLTTGLFYFDARFRPVPLRQTYIGVKKPAGGNHAFVEQRKRMDGVCYEKVRDLVDQGHQVMVFVFARNATVKSALDLLSRARSNNESDMFKPEESDARTAAREEIQKSRNRQLKELFEEGFAMHHAGMLRQDRSMVERYFAAGQIKVLCCTSTLAWGVNLPAHAVIIKGTQFYNPDKSKFEDIGILDVLQIFGRAGRPQYDTFGEGYIITTEDKLAHYLTLMMTQTPIESQFIKSLNDHLNGEIVLGTASNVKEAVRWLSYTYLYVRMRIKPEKYNLTSYQLLRDPDLENYRKELVKTSARVLDRAKMIEFDEETGAMDYTEIGRIASHYYIKHGTIELFNANLRRTRERGEILALVCKAVEFKQVKVRKDEKEELEEHRKHDCEEHVGDVTESPQKVNVLLQTHISGGNLNCFSLVSDANYVAQNCARIMRALFEIALHEGRPQLASNVLTLNKCVDQRMWSSKNPLRQLNSRDLNRLLNVTGDKFDESRLQILTPEQIGDIVHEFEAKVGKADRIAIGERIKNAARQFPCLQLDATVQPISKTVVRIRVKITPDFTWNDRLHGYGTSWWIWVESLSSDKMYHHEFFSVTKQQVIGEEEQELDLTLSVGPSGKLPAECSVKVVSDDWLGAESSFPLPVRDVVLPKEKHAKYNVFRDLKPGEGPKTLSITALQNPAYQQIFPFGEFNRLQRTVFTKLYTDTECNFLIGAAGGAGKSVITEIAMLGAFRAKSDTKVVYIAPLKSLLRRRFKDWRARFGDMLGKKIYMLSGDVNSDVNTIKRADIIVTSPEKWDAVCRRGQNIEDVSLLIVDQLQFLGSDCGPAIESIVARTKVPSRSRSNVRIVALSTPMSNTLEVAEWLDVKEGYFYNFAASARPVPLMIDVEGFSGKYYHNRAAAMNKPMFQDIRSVARKKPAIVFVSSKKQTTATAFELIACLRTEKDPKVWLHDMTNEEITDVANGITDENLKLALTFGVGMHHSGLSVEDRRIVEQLFRAKHIQVLVATKNLAWATDLRARLVVVKGTEQYDAKTERYVDLPVTDVLQMVGRAGRHHGDSKGTAVVMVHEVKRQYYESVLEESMNIESGHSISSLANHANAEIATGDVTTVLEVEGYIKKLFFFHRLSSNPSFYGVKDSHSSTTRSFVSTTAREVLMKLMDAECITTKATALATTCEARPLGRIAAENYVLPATVLKYSNSQRPTSLAHALKVLSEAEEFADTPVRPNEEDVNRTFLKMLPRCYNTLSVRANLHRPHTKAYILLLAHITRPELPTIDYRMDTRGVLDRIVRLINAMVEVSGERRSFSEILLSMHMGQSIMQARWADESPLLALPHITPALLSGFKTSVEKKGSRDAYDESLRELIEACGGKKDHLQLMLEDRLDRVQIQEIWDVLQKLPRVKIDLSISECSSQPTASSRRGAKALPITRHPGKTESTLSMTAQPNEEYKLHVNLRRSNQGARRMSHTPRYPKPKEVGWWLVLGEGNNLLSWKRIDHVFGRTSVDLPFQMPARRGTVECFLHLVSDCYLGLDRQFRIPFELKPAAIRY